MCMTMRMATVEEHRQEEVFDLSSSRRQISSSKKKPMKQGGGPSSSSSSSVESSVNPSQVGFLMLLATTAALYCRLAMDEQVLQQVLNISLDTFRDSATSASDPRIIIFIVLVLAFLFLMQHARYLKENHSVEIDNCCPLQLQLNADECNSNSSANDLPRTNDNSGQGLCRHPSSETISKLSSSIRNFSITNCRKLRPRGGDHAVLSRPEPFVPIEEIASLNLRDLTQIFLYITLVNRDGFQRSDFLSFVSSTAQQVISAMDLAVMESRGPNVESNIRSEASSCQRGDMDALYFAAAVRIYTEWRTACLVPVGYKRYALGVAMGRRDILQNIEKIETAVHSWIEARQMNDDEEDETCCNDDIQVISPTLRDLLVHEKETELHSQLPYLTDVSGANGLLWINRQLQLVNTTFIKSLQVPTIYETTKAASDAAYKEVYGPYHGWAVQQIFRQISNKSPDFDVTLKLLEKGCSYKDMDDHFTTASGETTVNTNLDNIKQPEPSNNDETTTQETPLDNFTGSIVREWDRLIDFISKFNCHDIPKKQRKLSGPIVSATDLDQSALRREQFQQVPMRTASDISSASDDEVSIESDEDGQPQDLRIQRELKNHTEQIARVLEEVTGLIMELNMNDPTKA